MTELYQTNQTFSGKLPAKGDYEQCVFKGIDCSGATLSDYKFIDCSFQDCNLSMANISRAAIREVKFIDCKLLGLRFDTCNQFGLAFSFEGCQLNHASFFKTKIKKTIFRNTQLQETDFTEADLSGALFDNCNLLQAAFENTMLEKADMRTSFDYSINPETNRIKGARFNVHGIAGLLDKYGIIIEQ